MSVDELAVLVEQLQGRGIARCEYESEQGSVALVFAAHDGAAVETAVKPPATDSLASTVDAPRAGHFVAMHPLQGVALASVGERVEAGAIIGFIQLGQVLEPVKTNAAGAMAGYCVAEGALVGYGTPVARLTPP
nr:hypothetical protein [uncultured Pseudomonas sp.]